MLLNLLSEYIVGTAFEDISPQIFKVLSDFCVEVNSSQKVSTGVEKDKSQLVRTTPTLIEEYQLMLKQLNTFVNLQKEFDSIQRKLAISKFATNDITANQDLFSSHMFANEKETGKEKQSSDFDDIK